MNLARILSILMNDQLNVGIVGWVSMVGFTLIDTGRISKDTSNTFSVGELTFTEDDIRKVEVVTHGTYIVLKGG